MTNQMKHIARGVGAAIITTILLSTVAHADKDADAARERAIRALYGEGLSIQFDKANSTITLDWDKSKMTPAQLSHYIDTYYRPKIASGITVARENASEIVELQYAASKAHVKTPLLGHAIIEPLSKLNLCRAIAKDMDTFDGVKNMELYCAEQAIKTANQPVFVFRGKRVTYDTSKSIDGLGVGEPLFGGKQGARDVAIAVTAPRSLDTFRSLKVVQFIAVNGFRYDMSDRQKILANTLRRSAGAKIKQNNAKMRKQDDKLAGKRGNVVFTAKAATGWEPLEPLSRKAKPPCATATAYAFGPRRGNKRDAYSLVVKLNGSVCRDTVEFGPFTKKLGVYSQCMKHVTMGDNKLEVIVSKNVTKKLGKRWDKKELRHKKIYSNRAGKRLVKKSFTCSQK